jgi:Protein of unknown function (DUF3738)
VLHGKLDLRTKLLLGMTGFAALVVPVVFGMVNAAESWAEPQTEDIGRNGSLIAQSTPGQLPMANAPTPDWQADAGGNQVFEVTSVKQNKSGSDSASMNVPIGPGDAHTAVGNFFSGTSLRLFSYIYFAYNLTGNQLQLLWPQLSRLPGWVSTDRFDILARANGNPTKDQMRLMMQSLLVDRFKLATHYETRQLPVFALVLAKPGKTGPQLRRHRH